MPRVGERTRMTSRPVALSAFAGLLLLISCATPAALFAQNKSGAAVARLGKNWPSFRGPDASGVAEGFAAPTTWNVERKKNVRWKTPIPGLGHSSPIVWGDRVFVTTALSGKTIPQLKTGLYGDIALLN